MGRPGAQLTDEPLAGTADASSKGEGALLTWIQQFAPYGIITLDESFRVQSWNHWMETHSARRFEEVAGKDLFALFPDLHQRKLAVCFERALVGEFSFLSTALHHYLLPLPSPFREPGLVHMLQTARITPIFSAGRVSAILVMIEDVTQRECQAEDLRRQHRRDEIISWSLAHLLQPEETRKTVRQLFFKIAQHLEFDTFFLYLRDLETGILSLDSAGGVPTHSENDFAECPFRPRSLSHSPEIVLLNSLQARSEPELAALRKAGLAAALAIPLMANARNLGLLCFATWSRESISVEEAELVTTLGQYLATALDREYTSRQLQTAREQLAHHAQDLEQQVQERTSRLQETIAELETFSYTLAHDLKAPMRGMSGYCDMLLEDFAEALPPRAKFLLEQLARTSGRMEALTQDLLAFSRVSRQAVVLSRVEIEPIIEDLAALRVPAVRQYLTLHHPLHAVLGHRALLQQVFSNLVDNALKYVEPRAVPNITIRSELVPCVTPNTRSGPLLFNSIEPAVGESASLVELPRPRIRFWVEDQGIGMPSEVHQKVFGIFERAVTSEHYEGTGIGLAIVARAMQRMGGTCGVESEPGKGSRFWLELPAA